MFLYELYRYHRGLFCGFVCFVFAYVTINYKWGMTAGPLNLFGMYSERMSINDKHSGYRLIGYPQSTYLDTKLGYHQLERLLYWVDRAQYAPQKAQNISQTMERIFHIKRNQYQLTYNRDIVIAQVKDKVNQMSLCKLNTLILVKQYYVIDSQRIRILYQK